MSAIDWFKSLPLWGKGVLVFMIVFPAWYSMQKQEECDRRGGTVVKTQSGVGRGMTWEDTCQLPNGDWFTVASGGGS